MRGLEFLVAHPQRSRLFGEDHARAAVAMLGTVEKLGELDLRLLELAAAVPGDACWRRAIDVATTRQGGSRAAVRAVFAVLGPEAVLSALSDPKPVVRRAGIDEVMVVRDQRAAPRLVELLADADLDVARGAAMACGHLQVAAAARPLVDRIAAIDSDPEMRQECLRALGKVGGDLAFPVLQRALMEKGRKIELRQQTKAESDYAVAAASILAREKFIDWLADAEKKWGLKFPKGASAAVLEAARALIHQHGPDALRATAKLHFKTAQQAMA